MLSELHHPYLVSFFLGIVGGAGYDIVFKLGNPDLVTFGYIVMGLAITGCIIEGVYMWHEHLKGHKRACPEIFVFHAVMKEIPCIHALICGIFVVVPAFLGAFLIDFILTRILL
ncbi:MAG: hypothetical protein LUQ33_02625 [Methanoregulaceae archaeon]|nr:hypothetical protein [Methanoregulaceae archaeon]